MSPILKFERPTPEMEIMMRYGTLPVAILGMLLHAITFVLSIAAEDVPPEADEQPAQAVEKQAEPAAAAEPFNLDVLVAPLQVLFGGNLVNGMMPEALDLAAPEVAAQNEAMLQQFLQQFRPYLTEELGFIRLVCSDLSKEQRPKIKAAGEAALRASAKQMADLQNRQNRGVGFRLDAQPEPRKTIRAALAKVLTETLTPDQMQRYTREANDRMTHRKRAAILSVISRLDGSLYLSPEQRDALIKSIDSNWQEKWEQWLMFSVYGNEYFPSIPDSYVVPTLNDDQKQVWSGLQKIEMGGWWGGNGQIQANDGWWGDEPEQNGVQNGAVLFLNGLQVFEAGVEAVEEAN